MYVLVRALFLVAQKRQENTFLKQCLYKYRLSKLTASSPPHKLFCLVFRSTSLCHETLQGAVGLLFEISMAHIKERLDELKEEDTIDEDEPPVGIDFLQYMRDKQDAS